MRDFDTEALKDYTLKWLDRKPLKRLADRLDAVVSALVAYDAHFMRLTDVLGPGDRRGAGEYDEDEAFEYIYDAYLADNPQDGDEDMAVAALLNQYMALKDDLLDL